MIKKVRAYWALFRTALHTIYTASKMSRGISKKGKAHDHDDVSGAFQKWARHMCRMFGVTPEYHGHSVMEGHGLLIGNHMSYVDIPVLVSKKPVSFVAKAEIENWPFFGPAGKAFGAVFIDRSSDESRKRTADNLKKAITEQERCVCVFPGGTTTLKSKDWRPGVFKLAEETGVPVQVFCITYTPADRAAFEVDSMLEHAVEFAGSKNVKADVTFGPVFKVANWEEDFKKWEAWNKEILLKSLTKQGLHE